MTARQIPLCQSPGTARRLKAYALTEGENGRYREAAAGYEATLRTDPADLESMVNLTVLYWQAVGGGPTASPEFSTHAGTRLRELLASAAHRFADRAEVRFWTKYIATAEAGEPLEPAHCRELMRQRPEYLEPAFVVFANSAGREAEPEAMRLLVDCAEQPTARGRYVSSVINGALRRQRWRRLNCPAV